MTFNIHDTPLFDSSMPESPFKELMKRLSHIAAKNCPYSEMSSDEYEEGYNDGYVYLQEMVADALYLYTVDKSLAR